MDPVAGAVLAATVGWSSILAVIRLPVERVVTPDRLRQVGAFTLAVIGLSVLGVPLPSNAPLGLMVAGMALASIEKPLRNGIPLALDHDAGLWGLRPPASPSPLAGSKPRIDLHGEIVETHGASAAKPWPGFDSTLKSVTGTNQVTAVFGTSGPGWMPGTCVPGRVTPGFGPT